MASETARYVQNQPNRSHICTACPVVVRYVECYEPKRIAQLIEVVSPMIAHARHIKAALGADTKVIFVGPCVGKKAEGRAPRIPRPR